ncbi:GntR family transcriptional regulator [bacterium]|nr:GntR family transcriptional regulator [bacterium]
MNSKDKIKQLKIDKKSALPIYYQIVKLFEECIFTGVYKPGDALPPELEIAEIFEVSRMTVRRAISELINQKLVIAKKGKGTFVEQPKLDDISFELGDFHEEMFKKNMTPRSKLVGVKIVRANKSISAKLEIPLNTRCLFFSTVISADDEPMVFERKTIKYTKQKPILETELKDPTLVDLAVIHGESFPTISKRVLHVSIVREDEVKILNVKPNTPVFVIEQTIYDSSKKPVGWGRSIYRGDKYKITSISGWSKDSIK